MEKEDGPDKGLLLEWRGSASSAAKLLMPSEYQRSILQFKQKKETKSSEQAMNRSKMKPVKKESPLKACAGGIDTPVVYDLSDSEGTPIARPLVRSSAWRRAAVAKPASVSREQFANAEVVTLDSDSDEEVSPAATVKSSGKVAEFSQPSTQGSSARRRTSLDDGGNVGSKRSWKVYRLREPVSMGGLLEKVISLDDEGPVGRKVCEMVDKLSKPVLQGGLLEKATTVDDDSTVLSTLSGNVFKLAETIRQGGSLEKAISLDDKLKVGTRLADRAKKLREPVSEGGSEERAISLDYGGMVGSKISEKVVKLTETIPQGGLREKAMSLDIEAMVGSTSSRIDIPEAKTAAVGQIRDSPPLWDDTLSRAAPSTLISPERLGAFEDNFQAACGSRKRPSFSVEGPNQSNSAQGAITKCFRPAHYCEYEESRCSSPVQPSFQDLTGSDDEVSPNAKLQFPGKFEMPREPIPQGGILVKDPSVGKKGSSSTTDVDVALKAVAGDVANLSPGCDDASPKAGPSWDRLAVKPNMAKESNLSSCDKYLQTRCGPGELPNNSVEGPLLLDIGKEAARKCLRTANACAHEENRKSSPVQPVFHDLTSDDDGCSYAPEWLPCDHEPTSLMRGGNSLSSMGHNYLDEGCAEQFLPNLRGSGDVNHHPGGKKRPLYIPGHESHENVSASAAEGLKILNPSHGAKRNCFGAVHDCVREENRRNSPIQPAFQDLTVKDDDSCWEPVWLRNNEPVPLGGDLNSGGSVAHDFSGQGRYDQFLPTVGGNSGPSDHVTGKKRLSLQVPGLESHENRETAVSSRAKNVKSEGGLWVEDEAKRRGSRTIGDAERRALDDESNLEYVDLSRRNVSKARKGAMSGEEMAAREAVKQREGELKKARQEDEKKSKDEKREDLKRQKQAAKEAAKQQKEAAAERRRLEKENNRWMKGKFALQNTTMHLDTTVVEMKDLGSLVLQQLSSKGYNYKIASNQIQGTIVWKIKRPWADSQTDTEGLGSQVENAINSQLSNSQLALEEVEMKYVVVVLHGEEFANLVAGKKVHEHLSGVRKQYPTYSVCYLINGLKKLLYKKEQHQFKTGDQSWSRPNVEQALAEFVTHYPGVHSRVCIDESEIADHLVGLMRSLAGCPYKNKLTSISVHANGDHVTKSDPNKDVIKKSTWLKFLVAIPRINGAIAIAIAKEYPTMRTLLNAYLDPLRTVHEKELLLQGLVKDTALGIRCPDGKIVGSGVSIGIYRILMARDGRLSTEDAEKGADHFTC